MANRKKKPAVNFNNLATHKTVRLEYEILETFEAGLVLQGHEVKSCKLGHINLRGSYAKFDKYGQIWLKETYVAPYKPANLLHYSPTRERKLLLKKKELRKLFGLASTAGTSIIPLKIYVHRNFVKAVIALVRGKKKYDKRETIKKREIDSRIRQKMKAR